MEAAYKRANEAAAANRTSRGHFVVDLCRPGHMTACLTTFQVLVLAAYVVCWVMLALVARTRSPPH